MLGCRRLPVLLASVFFCAASASPARAALITGSISNWIESSPYIQIGDGTNHVSMWWSLNTTDLGWFYGSAYAPRDTDVAVAVGVTDISQITDASVFTFSSGYIGPLCDADCSGTGVGTFVVWRNVVTSHYGVLRVDDITPGGIHVAALNGAWWFKSDGTADFSGAAIPEPGATLLLGLGLVAAARALRRR